MSKCLFNLIKLPEVVCFLSFYQSMSSPMRIWKHLLKRARISCWLMFVAKRKWIKDVFPDLLTSPVGKCLIIFPKKNTIMTELHNAWTSYSCSITLITHAPSGLILCQVVETHWCQCLFYSVDTVEVAFSLEPEEFKAKYGVSKPQLDAPELVFHCNMGGRGGRATETAHKLGFIK